MVACSFKVIRFEAERECTRQAGALPQLPAAAAPT